MSLFLRDYQRPGMDEVRVSSEDAKLGPVAVFLGGIGEAPTQADALLEGLAMAAGQGRRGRRWPEPSRPVHRRRDSWMVS